MSTREFHFDVSFGVRAAAGRPRGRAGIVSVTYFPWVVIEALASFWHWDESRMYLVHCLLDVAGWRGLSGGEWRGQGMFGLGGAYQQFRVDELDILRR